MSNHGPFAVLPLAVVQPVPWVSALLPFNATLNRELVNARVTVTRVQAAVASVVPGRVVQMLTAPAWLLIA